jgi:hypothetical protein
LQQYAGCNTSKAEKQESITLQKQESSIPQESFILKESYRLKNKESYPV